MEKTYNDTRKYSGGGDRLNLKKIFFDLADRAEISPKTYPSIFPSKRRGVALDHYYENIEKLLKSCNSDALCSILENYFKGKEYLMEYLTKWNNVTFKSIISASLDKSPEECPEFIFSRL